MKLFLLERNNKISYDEYVSHIIIAENSSKAREIANEIAIDEGYIWEDAQEVSCEEIFIEGLEGIIISNFNAG